MKTFCIFFALVATVYSQTFIGFDKLGTYRGFYADGRPYEKAYYMSSYIKTSWVNVRPFCQSYGMEILSLETAAEADSFLRLCQYNYNIMDQFTYIGGYSSQVKNPTSWYWVNSGKKIDYNLKWGVGMPNDLNGAGEHCLSIGKAISGFYFNDIYCYSPTNAAADNYKLICQTN